MTIKADWSWQLGHPDQITDPEIQNLAPYPFYYPRRYREPDMWYSPRIYATYAAVSYAIWADRWEELQTDPGADAIAREMHIDALLAQYKVPTWWVGKDLFDALINTTPPLELPLTNLKWPMPALLFMLPIDRVRAAFHRNIPFVAGARIYANTGQSALPTIKGYKPPEIRWTHQADGMSIKASVTTLDGQSDGTLSVASMLENNFEQLLSSAWLEHESVESGGVMTDEDRRRMDRFAALFVQLLLLMGSPQYLSGGELLVPGLSHGKGMEKRKVRPALFNPKWVGEHYKIKRGEPQGGTHASPKYHWRKGHWRLQPHGPGRTLIKEIWIEPQQIGL